MIIIVICCCCCCCCCFVAISCEYMRLACAIRYSVISCLRCSLYFTRKLQTSQEILLQRVHLLNTEKTFKVLLYNCVFTSCLLSDCLIHEYNAMQYINHQTQ